MSVFKDILKNPRSLSGRYAPPPEVRFQASFMPEPNSGCWLWIGSASPNGYGALVVRGKKTKAHRYSWMLHNGNIPDGMWVLHKCDVPACVNPEHLFLGSCADNVSDRDAKGRQASGERNGSAKLAPQQVDEIRKSVLSQRKLAKIYGVSFGAISKIKTGRYWNERASQ